MSTLKKRTRLGAALTAVLTAASIFALAAPASANAVPPDAVINLKVTGGVNKIDVDWDAPPAGEPATSYVVTIQTLVDGIWTDQGMPTVVLAPTTEAHLTGVSAGTYRVNVFSKNAYPGFGGPVFVDNVVVTNPVVIPPNVTVDTRPYRPYANVRDMVNGEYKLMTGCTADGRYPRLDEQTFWVYYISTRAWDSNDNANYNAELSYQTTDPGNPAGAPYAPADINKNNLIDPSELASAQQAANNEVYFQRRTFFITWLAENAEQTDGPAARLYTAYFARNADLGVCYWSNKLKSSKMSLLGVSEFFVQSSEFKRLYGGGYSTNAAEPGVDAAEFVGLIYRNVLNRTPDGSGFSFWTRQLQTQRMSPAEVMIGFSESQEFKTRLAPRVGALIAYVHLTGKAPTESDYVLAEFYGEYFSTSPSSLGFNLNSELYRYIVDLEVYKTRALAAAAGALHK